MAVDVALKSSVRSGSYVVDPAKVADAILDKARNDELPAIWHEDTLGSVRMLRQDYRLGRA